MGIQEQNHVSKLSVSEEWYGIVLYFLFMFWLRNFIRGVGWLCLGEKEIELCHPRRKIYQGIALQTCSSSPGLRIFFVICDLFVLWWKNPSWMSSALVDIRLEGTEPGLCWDAAPVPHPLWRPQQGLWQRSDPGDSASFISFGSQSVQAREIT